MDQAGEKKLHDYFEMFKFLLTPGEGCYSFDGEIGTGRFVSAENKPSTANATRVVDKTTTAKIQNKGIYFYLYMQPLLLLNTPAENC
jgi:hypothetical protein